MIRMIHKMTLLVVLMCGVGWISSLSAQQDSTKLLAVDSTISTGAVDTTLRNISEGVFGMAVLNDSVAAVAQASVGFNVIRFSEVDVNFEVTVGLAAWSTQKFQAFISDNLFVVWKPRLLNGAFNTSLIGSFSFGAIDSGDKATLQNVAGIDLRYQLYSAGKKNASLSVVLIAGYGVDWLQKSNNGFANIGIAFDEFGTITFDLTSLVSTPSSVIHVGRLR